MLLGHPKPISIAHIKFTAYPFTLGIASGDPLPDTVVLWTRLAPNPLQGGAMPYTQVPVDWQIARDIAMSSVVQKEP